MRYPDRKSTQRRAKPFAEAVPSAPASLRSRKQQVVRDALSAAALELFLAHGFEAVTVEAIARTAGVSRRTFFRYYKSKEDVMVEYLDRDGERFLTELAARPLDEPPLLAIRNALIPAVAYGLQEPELVRDVTRLLRETNALRRALMERRNRFEERIAALMIQRLGTTSADNTPILLAFLTRALNDTAINAWYDHETDDIRGLIDDLISRLYTIVTDMPPEFNKPRQSSR
ncbi:MAG: TetR family transcriptional regulator [Chloroflexi bacterium]|nr:TetR family transcriptional regulator [Chloroflexota bacterium]